MVGEKDNLRKETASAINTMLLESQETSPPTPRNLEVLVSGDTMKIDQTNVTLNIDDTNPFGGSEPNVPNTENVEEKLKQTEEEKRLIEVEKKKIEEAKYTFLEEDQKRKQDEDNKRIAEEERKTKEEEKKRSEEKKEREDKERKEEKEKKAKEVEGG